MIELLRMQMGTDRRSDLVKLISILAEARPHITRHVLAAAFVIVSAGVRFYLDDVFQKSFF